MSILKLWGGVVTTQINSRAIGRIRNTTEFLRTLSEIPLGEGSISAEIALSCRSSPSLGPPGVTGSDKTGIWGDRVDRERRVGRSR